MARSETFKLRLSEEELASYREAAGANGMDLAAWVRLACDLKLGLVTEEEDPYSQGSGLLISEPPFRLGLKKRKGMCEHRRRIDEYCARCDV